MNSPVYILGSGTMARDIGAYVLGRGVNVCWVSTDKTRRAELAVFGERCIRRISRADPALGTRIVAAAVDPAQLTATPANVVLESTAESLERKRASFAAAAAVIGPDTLILSGTSSILPADIDSRCAVIHFFAPVALTGIVEIVVERDRAPALAARVESFAESIGLEFVIQDERSAFAANRMLLPVQAAAVAALVRGVPPETVERVSQSATGLPAGALALMDTIGIETVALALANYRSRMGSEESARYEQLATILTRMVATGKLGRRNANGFLCGESLAWTSAPAGEHEQAQLTRTMSEGFADASERFVREGLLTRDDVGRLVRGALGVSTV